MYSSDFEVSPKTPAEVYSAYTSVGSSVLVGGGWGLGRSDGHYDLAIKLDNVNLDYIYETDDEIIIGAMTTLETMETSPILQTFAGGVIASAIHEITDKELKKAATMGGVLACKDSFSVLLPILLSLHVDVQLYEKGRMGLKDYLPCPPMEELILQISIAKELLMTTYQALRKTPDAAPYLVGAVTMWEDSWRIVVGGRPGMAAIADNAREILITKGMSVRENVARVASEELDFGDDANCTEAQRRKLTVTLVRDLISRAWKGFSRMTEK